MKINGLKYLIALMVFLVWGCTDVPVNWQRTFDSKDTIPYGTYVLRQELSNMFPDSQVYNIHDTGEDFFEYFHYDYTYDQYIFIRDNVFYDDSTWENIVGFVSRGGTAFISLPVHNLTLERSLGLKTTQLARSFETNEVKLSVKTPQNLNTYIFEKGFNLAYFSDFEEYRTEVLGYINYDGTTAPNFLKIYHGEGAFFVHTEPIAFTNYYLLKTENDGYINDLFSYLGSEDIIWDNHRIYNRHSGERNDGGFFNGLDFIMKHDSLRWSFFLLIILGILYLLFNSKRRQKAVPILLPYTNYTLDFAKTLSELYRYNKDHTAMVRYKINYFLEQIRQHYNITSKDTEKDFSELLSSKSGVDIDLCRKIVVTIDIFKSRNYLDKEDFFKLHSLIEKFNQKSNNYGRPIARKTS
ncbi:MAG: DUF4350 domain-containing protein [Flavobacteriaceae bacterium]|jgi:hypothetical protein|nr:DUF4350 domain-containing protein [Flavobacteriaceae bacterium]